VIALGLAQWGLAPDALWRLTPREIAAALRGSTPPTPAPPGREALDEMMRRYPDGGRNE
jgi:uncharacterized phage protein (TIGR02216 family)